VKANEGAVMDERFKFIQIIAACMIGLSGNALALQGNTTADDEELLAVWYTSADCENDMQGPGSSPDNPIEIKDFDELYYTAKASREDGDEDDSSEKTPPEAKYECRWIKLTGFYSWMDYYHYRGILNADFTSAYFDPQIRYIVENFKEPTERRTRLNGSRVTLTGRFYDLCRRADVEATAAGEFWWIFGPCHYGKLRGLMLRDVTIDAIEAGPNLRVSGEQNRDLIGDLAVVPLTWPETNAVRNSFIEWISALRTGREAYWAAAIETMRLDDDERAEELADALSDPDDWISFLTQSGSSPLKRFSDTVLKRHEFRIFEESSNDTSEDRTEVTACICLSRSCRDAWPLFGYDSSRFADKYLCNQFTRDGVDETWQWSPQ